jgi:hypothetical protein
MGFLNLLRKKEKCEMSSEGSDFYNSEGWCVMLVLLMAPMPTLHCVVDPVLTIQVLLTEADEISLLLDNTAHISLLCDEDPRHSHHECENTPEEEQ